MAAPTWTLTERTRNLIAAAAEAWRRGLVDVSAGNKRLFYSPLRVGTLILADADPQAFAKLLRGKEVKLRELVPDDGMSDGLARSARAHRAADLLFAKGKIGEEETGDNPVRLALGLATWAPEQAVVSGAAGPRKERCPAAPLLLAPVTFSLVPGTRHVSTLELSGEPELNTALRYVLRAQHKVDLDAEGWLADAVSPDGSIDPDRLVKAATRLASRVPGWEVAPHVVVDSFGSDRELMLRDLEDEDVLAEHPLLAAMAGDQSAQALVRGPALPTDGSDLAVPDTTPPAAEHLVLDADASQHAVISHALAGRNLVVQGPPGTGKSQTIANLLAEAMAVGKTVLFVAQKRAAVDAVMTRLEAAGLADNVLEVFDSTTRRGNVIAQLRDSLDNMASVPVPDPAALHRDLAAARAGLIAHYNAMHAARKQLAGGTVYELLGRIAGIPALHQSAQRLPFATVAGWQGAALDRLASLTAELTTLGGLDPNRAGQPGWNVGTVITEDAAAAGYDLAAAAATSWPAARDQVGAVLNSVALPAALTVVQAKAGISLLTATASILQVLTQASLDLAALDDATLARMTAAVGTKQERKALPQKVGMFERRRLRKQIHAFISPTAPGLAAGTHRDDSVAHGWLASLAELRARWASAPLGTPDAAPRTPQAAANLDLAETALGALAAQLDRLDPLLQHTTLDALTFDDLGAALNGLLADPRRTSLPRAYEVLTELHAAGADPVLAALTARIDSGQEVDPTFAANRLRFVAYSSTLEHLQSSDRALGREAGQVGADEDTFRLADRAHITSNRTRVARAAAERTVVLLNGLASQTLAVKDQVRRKRSFKSLRQLVDEAPEALLALKPCWAMSPLLVSRYLPAVPGLFDLVVFDEASQVLVPDAVPSLLRAKQAVVAGDDKQLPPTTVFTKMLDANYDAGSGTLTETIAEVEGGADEDVELPTATADRSAAPDDPGPPEPTVSVASGYQSILGALGLLLSSRTLLWHYRSRDERLIAVSNAEVYGNSLITFPGPAAGEVLEHVVVPPSIGIGEHNKSPAGEVEAVRNLVLAHARNQLLRPAEDRQTLGVIAMGREHADRVEKSVFTALETAPDREELAELFDDSADEPYFFKNIERVQGDERDVIILTVGYGVSRDGRMHFVWGPLLGEYGVNRLNVAISRARAKMTLVTSFPASELTEARSSKPGYQLMRAFVDFAASGGTNLQSAGLPVPMNPFEQEIHDRLTATGMVLDPQYGVSGYRLDFAARHPDYDGTDGPVRHILAIECDGRTWHSGWTARERDRLRQQQLEALGWRFHRIWSTDWFRDPDVEVDSAVDAFNEAVGRSRDGEPPALALPEPPAQWQGAAAASTVRSAAARRALPRWVYPGSQITAYTDSQLLDLVRWLRADGVLRLADDEIGELIEALGLRRRGQVIVGRLTAAQRVCDTAKRGG